MVAGVTGAILTFKADYDRWMHPSLWRVDARATRFPEEALLESDDALLWITRTSPWHVSSLPRAVVPDPPGPHLDLDRLAFAADRALPAATYAIRVPLRDRSPFQFLKHATSGAGHSTVFVDQYTGSVLRVDDFRTLPGGDRAHEIVRAVHTGDLLGGPTRVLNSLSSLGLALLVLTGTLIKGRKLSGSSRLAIALGLGTP
jgi:uncharacterized iron-regulated membrane protein